MEKKPLLPSNLKLRPAQWTDSAPIAGLILAVCTADGNPNSATSEDELITYWKDDRFVLETDAWIVESESGEIVGYQEFFNRHVHAVFEGDLYIHPEHPKEGIGEALLAALETRAREDMLLAEPALRIFIRSGMAIGDTLPRKMHEDIGYLPVRYAWQMEIILDELIPEIQFPEKIELRPFNPEQDARLVFEATEEAFSEHWGHTPESFENWVTSRMSGENFNPELWFIAWDGNKIAGISLCRYRGEIGYVGLLGVLKPYRKQGLAFALLQHSFNEFYKRGTKTVGLGVDASNPTGAIRLYERAGMKTAHEFVIYEKELRAGITS